MNKKFKFTLVSSLIIMLMALIGCQSSSGSEGEANGESPSSNELTVWGFTDEPEYAIEKFEEKNPDVKVNFVHIPSEQYETKLRSALQTGIKAPDVFALENGYVRKFVDSPALANLSEYGADELIKDQYKYVQAIEKDSEGNVKVAGYQGTPGGFYYRRDLAKEYLGTDKPSEVSEMISSWDKIFDIGQKVAKESNGKVHALANWVTIDTVQVGAVEDPWVEDGKLTIPSKRLEVLDLSEKAIEKNAALELEDWGPAHNATMTDGTIMFYPGATWFLNVNIKDRAPDTSGLWGLAHGPSSFYRGGTYFGMYNESENKELAWEFIKFHNFDQDFLKQLASEQSYFTSNREVNAELAPEIRDEFLGDQAFFEFFGEEAENIPSIVKSEYNSDIESIWKTNVGAYMKGNIETKEDFISEFKKDVKHDFPELEVE